MSQDINYQHNGKYALTNSCNILASQLFKLCLKGEKFSISISEDEYLIGFLDCQNVHIRFTFPKGVFPSFHARIEWKNLKVVENKRSLVHGVI